jgi:prepilin-type N-terminal cleavage/methylation domain-containing protein
MGPSCRLLDPMNPASTARDRRGFTIVELIVVILIIVIISAILLPALGGARDVAKKTATTQLMNNLVAAAGRFEQDTRRMPGYFSPTEMGGPDQSAGTGSGRGMSAMENIMLDLAGGIVVPASGSGSGGGGPAPDPTSLATLARNVGPSRDRDEQVDVDTALIGTSNGSFAPYFTPDIKNYQPQFKTMKAIGQNAAPPHADTANKATNQLPDLIDAFGTPILAWVQDDTATQPITSVTDFATKASSGTTRARFYWNSNSCFLTATALGKKQLNMATQSLLGSGGDTERANTLAALLGNPGYPDDRTKGVADILPTAGTGPVRGPCRGRGRDLPRQERGGREARLRRRDESVPGLWLELQEQGRDRPHR